MRTDQTLLAELGARVRQGRERAGWSVSELARQAGVSRRYVTETEAGRANLSILKLARFARALRLELSALCDIRLAPAHPERVALVGLRGAGKSSVGRKLALALEVPFIELDARVEKNAGMSLAEIFDLHGVETYRQFEREALEDVLAEGSRMVIATGGSIVTSPATFARLRDACRTIWLRATPREHLQRVIDQGDQRPMAGRPRALSELSTILEQRADAYAQCDESIDTSGQALEAVVDTLLAEL